MSLLDKLKKFEESKNEVKIIPERKSKASKENSRPVKLHIPAHIKVLFDNLDKSISSVWGVQKDGKIKWDAKYNMWLAFKEYFKELM